MYEIDDKRIILSVNKIIASFLVQHLPSDNPDVYLSPNLPLRLQHQIRHPRDLMNADLYANLRVLIYNDRYFRDARVYNNDSTINGVARITLSYRNRLAHESYNDVISIEHQQLEYVAINRLISLLPTDVSIQDQIEETRTYIGSILVHLAKEYFNTEIATTKKVVIKLANVGEDADFAASYEDSDDANTPIRISISECKQQLRRLREIIQEEVTELPKWSNLLRETLLDKIVENKITSKEMFDQLLLERDRKKTDERQHVYWEKIKQIIDML
jgi:hypothetical protein